MDPIQEEDTILLALVESFGPNAWRKIAEQHPSGRNPKQCRERYFNHLRPGLNRGEWTDAERHKLEDLV